MFRKHKGKFAAGSRGRTPGEQTPPGSQKKERKGLEEGLARRPAGIAGAHCGDHYFLS